MRGILLAGGLGKRMLPLTRSTNKHMLPIHDKPMLQHNVEKMRDCGIRDVIIVTGEEFCGDIVSYFGSGREFGINICYKIQDTANGIAGALNLCKDIIQKNDRMLVMLGDNITTANLNKYVDRMLPYGAAKVLLHETETPKRFGIAEVDNDGFILSLEEKPQEPKSNLAVCGYYYFDYSVFDYIRNISLSERGEYEIVDILKQYLYDGALYSQTINEFWSDCGTIETFIKVNNMFYTKNFGVDNA